MEAWRPRKDLRIVALLIWYLSKLPDLSLCYILARRAGRAELACDIKQPRTVVLMLVSWMADPDVLRSLHAGLLHLDDCHRLQADIFLVQSMLVQFIVSQNKKGLTVDLSDAIAKYVKYWSYRPTSEAMRVRLARLVWHRHSRRRFGVELRKEWCLCIRSFTRPRAIQPVQIRRRVPF